MGLKMKKRIEQNVYFECKLCKEIYFDRKVARNHISTDHKLESRLLNMSRRPTNKKLGRIALLNRKSEWVDRRGEDEL